MSAKVYCTTCAPFATAFCPVCGKADKAALGRIRLMGPVGVLHSNSPKIEAFWATGDPAVLK
jgi:hypothetical protein